MSTNLGERSFTLQESAATDRYISPVVFFREQVAAVRLNTVRYKFGQRLSLCPHGTLDIGTKIGFLDDSYRRYKLRLSRPIDKDFRSVLTCGGRRIHN